MDKDNIKPYYNEKQKLIEQRKRRCKIRKELLKIIKSGINFLVVLLAAKGINECK